MGEAAGKMTKHEPHNRVIRLRSEIESKRAALTMEIEELKNRKEAAMVTTRKVSKLAAFVVPTLFATASLTGALLSLGRKDDEPQPMLMDADLAKSKSVQAAAGTSVLMTMATNALRWALMEYVRKKFGTLDIKKIVESLSESKRGDDSSVASDKVNIYSSSTS